MIRFPERFHASVTPGAHLIGIEPNYRENERTRASSVQVQHVPREPRPKFDFSALRAVLG